MELTRDVASHPRTRSRLAGNAKIECMTAKERLLEQAPTWSEEQAQRALLAVEPESTVDAWGNLSAMTDAAAAETMQRLEEEERAAGHEPWQR
jgi:muramidase (phage lysozyme)